jgi:3-phenylpropionate/trans-cinnamate dioxygenase ferredoxin reductase subunit
VDIRAGTVVSALRTTKGGVVVEFEDAPALAADLVVVGIGITPNVAVAAASGVHVDDGIVVDAQGRTSIPNVYAAGDVARRYSDRVGRHVRVEHFDNANKQGAAAANAMLGRDAVSDEPNWFWSDQFGRNIQFVGTASTTGELVIRGDLEGLDFTAFYLDGGIVSGAFTMDRGEDVMATRELLGRGVDTAMLVDESTDLWDLADTAEAMQ